MLSGLERTDVIAESYITKPYHWMSNYEFDEKFATLTLFPDGSDNYLDKLGAMYKKIVSTNAQIYESAFKIIALQAFLEKRGFKYVILNWMDPEIGLSKLPLAIKKTVLTTFDIVRYLDEYAGTTGQRIPGDGHPTPDAHLSWTREYLIPYLEAKNLVYPYQ